VQREFPWWNHYPKHYDAARSADGTGESQSQRLALIPALSGRIHAEKPHVLERRKRPRSAFAVDKDAGRW
jgi:hypothetical protein